ncbi:MAG: hypothetical protein HFG91_07665 [Acholeplasmatales bacterium]|nr:hypothetical protein [Acholeplasmatales bacterium]
MMVDLEPLILASGPSIWVEKARSYAQRLVKPLKWFWKKYVLFWEKLKLKFTTAFHIWYYEFYQKQYKVFRGKLKKTFWIIAIISLIISICFGLTNIISKAAGAGPVLQSLPIYAFSFTGSACALELLIYLAFVIFMKKYHFLIGEESIRALEREFTKQYVIQYAPDIAKFWTHTGGGKDEGIAGFSTMKIEGFREEIIKRKEEIRKICYIFDFDTLERVIPYVTDWFASSNEKVTKTNFFTLCKNYRFFIKRIYKNKININVFCENAKRLKDNKLYTAKYVYDRGGINKEHFLNMLYDYVMLRVREYENRFIFSNQPFFEDLETGRTAAIFSLNYLITRKQKARKFKEKNELGQMVDVDYVEKIQFPFKDYLGFIETEVGTWYINLDKKITNMLADLGIRDFKAFNRHILQHFFWYQADQAPERVSKIFRELDHSFIHPDTRVVYLGGEAANFFIKRKLEALEKRLAKMADKYEKSKNKNTRRDEKIKRLNRYWVASSKAKYKNRMDNLREGRKIYNFEFFAKSVEEKIFELMQEMALNIYEHSYIEKILTIGKNPATNSGNPVYTPKEILANPDITKSTYSVKTTFKLSDCWRYNTHYMARIKKNRAEQSELNLVDVKTWTPDLELHDENIKDMAYVQGADIMGLIVDEVVKTRYKRLEI